MSFVYGLIIFFITFLIITSLSLVGYIICLPNTKREVSEIECDCEDEEKRWLKMVNKAVSNVGKECKLSANNIQLPIPAVNQAPMPNINQTPISNTKTATVNEIPTASMPQNNLKPDRLPNEDFKEKQNK